MTPIYFMAIIILTRPLAADPEPRLVDFEPHISNAGWYENKEACEDIAARINKQGDGSRKAVCLTGAVE